MYSPSMIPQVVSLGRQSITRGARYVVSPFSLVVQQARSEGKETSPGYADANAARMAKIAIQIIILPRKGRIASLERW